MIPIARATTRITHMCIRRFSQDVVVIPKKAVVTASLNGVLTDPKQFNIPVTPDEMAVAASEAYDAGATVVHIHIRNPEKNKGHLPTWEPEHAKNVVDAIRDARPELIINMTTGTIGKGPSPMVRSCPFLSIHTPN